MGASRRRSRRSGSRLVDRGHTVTVYLAAPRCEVSRCRQATSACSSSSSPRSAAKAAETLTHSALSSVHATTKARPDVAFVFNSANAVFLPLLRAWCIPVGLHTDGIEWQRAKWNGAGKRYYRMAELLAVRWADALIAYVPGIADYFSAEFGAGTELLSYGAPGAR